MHIRIVGGRPRTVWHIACPEAADAQGALRASSGGRVSEQKALIVGRDLAMQRYLQRYLSERGCQSVVARTIPDALECLARGSYKLTVIDLDHESITAADFVSDLKLQPGDPGTVVGLGNDHPWPLSIAGIDQFVGKPSIERDLDRIVRALVISAPSASSQPSHGLPAVQIPREMALWQSPRMRQVRAIIEESAGVDVTLLITGETGSGKDVVARAVHALSSRRSGPYIKVNCAAVPHELLETELFGHERGAFTGAHKLNVGKFEAAHNGTIFLDEIGDLDLALQAKVLHVLQDGEFSRVGGKTRLRVDARVLAATNQDLERCVAEGRFREDLYYRLNVIQIVVPPLRERMEEVPALVEHFVNMYAKIYRRPRCTVPPVIMERLMRHRYPGNVRELENLIKRMIVLGDPFLGRATDPASARGFPTRNGASPITVAPLPLKDMVRRASLAAEREIIAKALDESGGNRVRAAKALRISYRALLYKIKRVGLPRVRPAMPNPVLPGDDVLIEPQARTS
jgi:two-component system, NtrC family, response regulator AtoC